MYTFTGTIYFKKLGVKIKLLTDKYVVDLSKGAEFCYNFNVVGIVMGKICVQYENKTFYLDFKFEAFKKSHEKKIQLFTV